MIDTYVEKCYFPKDVARTPGEETVPKPEDDECVVFWNFFKAGFRLPCNYLVHCILDRFGVKIHQLTPNAFMTLSKFFWAVSTFNDKPHVDSFIRYYELHPQPQTMMIDGTTKEAQFGYCSFVPRRRNAKLGIEKVDFCFGQKNKWDGDWLSYWFYAKIAHTSSRSLAPKFPFACKVEAANFKTTVEFIISDNFSLCGRAFELATRTLTSRDI